MLEDASYLLFGLLLVFLSVWSFTTSLTVTIASITSIGFSLGLAYFTYTFVFRLSFFPFMNILAVIIALGVGADDTFILSRVWQQHTSTISSTKLESLVSNTLHHSLLSMLVTSITTTVAFFSSYISNITAIKCFRYEVLLILSVNLVWVFSLGVYTIISQKMFRTLKLDVLFRPFSTLNQLLNLKQKPDTPLNLGLSNGSVVLSSLTFLPALQMRFTSNL